MTGRGHQLLHADALAAELEALGLDASIFGAAGIPAPVFANLIPRRAGVWDTLPNTFGFADFSSAFTRATDGLYRDGAGKWQAAGSAVIRPDHDANGNFLGLLFEPESVNKTDNYNANPDAALTNVGKTGDAAAVLSRVDDATELAAAGLDAICTSGFVFKLDNSAGSTNASALITGTVANTNTHTVSAFARNDAANPGVCTVKISGVGGVSVQVTGTTYARLSDTGTPDATTRQFEFLAPAGNIGYWVLNQIEEQPVATSPIITLGASATRAVDALSWPLADWQSSDFINDGAGMAAILWRPGFANTDLANNTKQTIVSGLNNSSSSALISVRTSTGGAPFFWTHDSTTVCELAKAWVADTEYLIAVRWNAAANEKQLGVKVGGAWSWATATAYDGSQPNDAVLNVASTPVVGPAHHRGLALWDQDEDTAFLEKVFSHVAN